MNLFDSHMHLNHEAFHNREESVWMAAREVGVSEAVVIGYNLESSQTAVRLAESLPGLYASVGVSPHDILTAPSNYIDELQSLAGHPKVVAIGECGLEYHYPAGPKEIQIERFLAQSELARALGKMLVVHLREADDDFLQILLNHPPSRAILHCFTASSAVMDAAVHLGYFISFSGILTFKNAHDLHAIAPQIPAENLLIETDAPYLAPNPFRGKTCEPQMIVETARQLARLRNTDIQTIARQTYENAYRAFGLES